MEHLEQYKEGIAKVRTAEWELTMLAAAFDRTGNVIVATELRTLASQLADGINEIGAAFSTELDRGFRQAQQHSATVLEAVLAGVQVGRA